MFNFDSNETRNAEAAAEPKAIARAVLLERYFTRRAQASIGKIPTFKLGQIVFGYGFIDDTDDTVKPIPLNAKLTDIQEVWRTTKAGLTPASNPQYRWDENNKQIVLRVEVPINTINDPAGKDVNLAVILDDTGEAVAIMAGQPTKMNANRSYIIDATIKTTIS